ncbi:MAG: ATP-dependent metallopeptidase FtsH/Yme1/Tma family protein, partial [Breznakiellaceae bacterium]
MSKISKPNPKKKKGGTPSPFNHLFPGSGNGNGPLGNWQWRFSLVYVVILVVLMSLFNYVFLSNVNPTIDFSEFKAKIASGEIKRVELDSSYYTGYTTDKKETPDPITRRYSVPQKAYRTVPIYDPDLIKLMDEKGVSYYAVSKEGSAVLDFIFSWVLPFAFFFFIWRLILRRVGNMGSNVLSIGQNRAVIVAEGDVVTRFSDVAGVDEAKEELMEVVDFLRNPRKYTEIGGKIPKGVLLVGPPGT